MNEQIFQVLLWIAGVTVTAIGVLLSKSVFNRFDAHTQRMNKHSERMDMHEQKIANNSKLIELNSERDKLIRESIENNMSELKGSVEKMNTKFDSNSALLQEVLINLKSQNK